MDPTIIASLVVLAIKEAPEVLNVLAAFIKIFTSDDVDAHIDLAELEALRKTNEVLGAIRRASLVVEHLDFGGATADEQNLRRFNEVVATARTVAAAIGKQLAPGEAESLAQAGFWSGRAGYLAPPILHPPEE